MQARLLIRSIQQSRLLTLVGQQNGGKVELETLGDLVLEFHLRSEGVGGSPRLGEGETVGLVRVLGLDVSVDGSLCVSRTRYFESDVGRSGGLDLEGSSVDGEVFAQEVI